MRKLMLLAAVWSLGLTGCAGRDMDEICPIAREVLADRSIGPEVRFHKLTERLDAAVWSPSVRQVLGAIGNAEPGTQYLLLKAGAAEVGRPDWSCPPLDEAFAPQLATS